MSTTLTTTPTIDVTIENIEFLITLGYICLVLVTISILFLLTYRYGNLVCSYFVPNICKIMCNTVLENLGRQNIQLYNLENATVINIPIGNIQINDDEKNNDECVICLEEFNKKEIFLLHCGHQFHLECWEKWENEKDNPSCPICRYNG